MRRRLRQRPSPKSLATGGSASRRRIDARRPGPKPTNRRRTRLIRTRKPQMLCLLPATTKSSRNRCGLSRSGSNASSTAAQVATALTCRTMTRNGMQVFAWFPMSRRSGCEASSDFGATAAASWIRIQTCPTPVATVPRPSGSSSSGRPEGRSHPIRK